jgi:hypothetical protein
MKRLNLAFVLLLGAVVLSGLAVLCFIAIPLALIGFYTDSRVRNIIRKVFNLS